MEEYTGKHRSESIPIDEELLVNCYHRIILELEFPKAIGKDMRATAESISSIKNFEYKLNKVEIFNQLRELGLNARNAESVFEVLKSRGFLVELPEDSNQKNVDAFRTLHMDILIRSAEIRTKWGSMRYIVTPRVSAYRIKSPSRKDRTTLPLEQGVQIERKLYSSIKNFFNDEKTSKDFINILREYLSSGFDGYQAFVLASMLESKSKAFVLTAPTGSGKTEIFLFYILARLMKRKHEGQSKERAVLVYPRRFLSIDQAARIIRLLAITNRYGYNLTFGLRDSATPRKDDTNVKDGDYFRGLKCPDCNAQAQLVYDIEAGSVRCSLCKKGISFIKSTRPAIGRDPPDVIVTNMWALEVRMMDNNEDDLNINSLSDTGIIVVDEAHEYTGLSGGLVSNMIKLLLRHNMEKSTVIISSATMPFAKNFAYKLSGIPENEIKEYNFYKIIEDPELREEIRISGERLALIGIFDINPRFSWSTYCQLWTVLMAFLYYAYTIKGRQYIPQSIVFIDNIKELRRTHRGYEENISLGEPRDHIIGPPGRSLDSSDSYSYWHYLSPSERSTVLSRFRGGMRLNELIEKVAEVHSLVEETERRKVINSLDSGEIGVVYSTSALELGVDYQNVSFILNAGFTSPLSLAQRIGRGGRSVKTLRTVLGIILSKNTPSETLLSHSPDVGDRLDPSARKYEEQLPVASDNPQIRRRREMIEGISFLAKKGKATYASGKGIIRWDELQEFLSDLVYELRGVSS